MTFLIFCGVGFFAVFILGILSADFLEIGEGVGLLSEKSVILRGFRDGFLEVVEIGGFSKIRFLGCSIFEPGFMILVSGFRR